MKLQSVRVVSLSAFVLMGFSLAFAAGQPKLRVISTDESQKTSAVPQAVQFGKGAGRSRNQAVTNENSLHLKTAVESLVGEKSGAFTARLSDSVFRK